MRIMYFSLLSKEIYNAAFNDSKVMYNISLPVYIGLNGFSFEEKDKSLNFPSFHFNLSKPIDNNIKEGFLTSLSDNICSLVNKYKIDKTIILLPDSFYENLLLFFENSLRIHNCTNILILRQSALLKLFDNIKLNGFTIGEIVSKINNNFLVRLNSFFQKIIYENFNPIEIEWPIEIGILTPEGKFSAFFNNKNDLPLSKIFNLNIEPTLQHREEFSFILLCKYDYNSFIHIAKIAVPINKTANDIKYSINLSFEYSWNGTIILSGPDGKIETKDIRAPFLVYAI